MKFWQAGPRGVSQGNIPSPTTSRRAAQNKSASRTIYGANKTITCAVFCKPNGAYSGAKGLDIKVGLSKQGTRFVLQFFTLAGVQLDGNVLCTGGLGNLPTALAAKALLAPHFYVRMLNLTDQEQDAGLGESNAVPMRIR